MKLNSVSVRLSMILGFILMSLSLQCKHDGNELGKHIFGLLSIVWLTLTMIDMLAIAFKKDDH